MSRDDHVSPLPIRQSHQSRDWRCAPSPSRLARVPAPVLAHSVSRAGDAFNTVALVVLVFELSGSGLGVAGVVNIRAVYVVSAVLLVAAATIGLTTRIDGANRPMTTGASIGSSTGAESG